MTISRTTPGGSMDNIENVRASTPEPEKKTRENLVQEPIEIRIAFEDRPCPPAKLALLERVITEVDDYLGSRIYLEEDSNEKAS